MQGIFHALKVRAVADRCRIDLEIVVTELLLKKASLGSGLEYIIYIYI